MSGGPEALAERLEPFRTYLQLLARLHLDPRLRAKVDLAGVVQQTLWEGHRALGAAPVPGDAEVAAPLRRLLANNLADEVRKCYAGRRAAALLSPWGRVVFGVASPHGVRRRPPRLLAKGAGASDGSTKRGEWSWTPMDPSWTHMDPCAVFDGSPELARSLMGPREMDPSVDPSWTPVDPSLSCFSLFSTDPLVWLRLRAAHRPPKRFWPRGPIRPSPAPGRPGVPPDFGRHDAVRLAPERRTAQRPPPGSVGAPSLKLFRSTSFAQLRR
jgi:hypothetical protein